MSKIDLELRLKALSSGRHYRNTLIVLMRKLTEEEALMLIDIFDELKDQAEARRTLYNEGRETERRRKHHAKLDPR